jgi:hypothetical protein
MRHHRAQRKNDGSADKYVVAIVLLVWNILLACGLPVKTWRIDNHQTPNVIQRK